MIKATVFLGYRLTATGEEWKRKWLQDEVNDTIPYGYDRVEKDHPIKINFVTLKKYERIIFFNKYFRYFYIYYFKLIVCLLLSDVVWTYYDKDAIFIAKLKKIPVLNRFIPKHIACFIWLIDECSNLNKKQICRYKSLLDKIDKIIFHSKTEKEKFVEYFDLPECKLQYVTFGINTQAYSQSSTDRRPKNLGVKGNFILFVGTDRHRDIELLKKIGRKFSDQEFVVATCTKKYLNANYPRNFNVLTTDLRGMRWLYKYSKFVIIPSLYNEHASGCTTIMESAAIKKAVIVSEVPGIEDYVVNGVTGIVISLNLNDEQIFFPAVERLLTDTDYADKLGENAYEWLIERDLTTERWARDHYQITKEILDKERP